jgi:hypothetical protein
LSSAANPNGEKLAARTMFLIRSLYRFPNRVNSYVISMDMDAAFMQHMAQEHGTVATYGVHEALHGASHEVSARLDGATPIS